MSAAQDHRVGALKRLLIGVIWIPIALVIVYPIALLFAAIHAVLATLAFITTIDSLKLGSIFWSIFWDILSWSHDNTKFVLGVGVARGPVHAGFSIVPSFSSTAGKVR